MIYRAQSRLDTALWPTKKRPASIEGATSKATLIDMDRAEIYHIGVKDAASGPAECGL